MDLMECMEILFSLFGGFACFRLCLKHSSEDLHRYFSHKFYKSHEYLSLRDSLFLIDYIGVYCFLDGDLCEVRRGMAVLEGAVCLRVW